MNSRSAARTTSVRRRGEQGSATVVVFILLTLVVAMLIGNSRALRHLRQEIRLVEQKQLQQYAPAGSTNSPAVGADRRRSP